MTDLLLQPHQIGNLIIPNRIVMTAVKLGYATKEGGVTERHIAFYRRRAQGGVGLITTEPMYIQMNGRELPTQLGIQSDALIPGLQRLTNAVHESGGRIMAHINHAGRVANPSLIPADQMVSAYGVLCPANQVTPHPLSRQDIKEIIAAFASAAFRAKQSGFDAIEIPFSHGYLIHQFLSPHTNLRDDEYGGAIENRCRFGREIILAIREKIGPEFPLVVRMNAKDYVEDGLVIEDAIYIARKLEQLNVAAVSITSGTMCESVAYSLYPTGTPKANLLPMVAKIKQAVDLPVIVAGRIRTPSIAREALESQQTDLIGLGRALLADPDWVQKVRAKDEESIILCAACHQGCLAQLRIGEGTHCVFNPLTGREAEIEIIPAVHHRKITIVGGGPAGMEAAYIAALRGHHVTLYEKENRLGGQFYLAAQAPHKEELLDFIRYQTRMIERVGVNFKKNIHVTAKMLFDQHPDVVVLATGSVPLTIPFPGLEDSNWMMASDLLDGTSQVNSKSALVIGGGLVGLETADYLSKQGHKIILVEMLPKIGADMDPLAKSMLLERLNQQNVEIHKNSRVMKLTENEVFVQQGEDTVQFPIETVVMAVGVRANRELEDSLENSGLDIKVIGDALKPRKVLEAVWEGFKTGLEL